MSFLIRSAVEADLGAMVALADQFSLLNMPPDETIMAQKINRSLKSFAGKLEKKDAEYLFVLEDLESKKVAGSSLILAKHGTKDSPHTYFQVLKKERFSKDLGVGFIHTVLRFSQNTDGPTEIGGLLVDKSYRRRPEKLGKQISLMRFIYMGLFPSQFEENVLCELSPPLTREGRSEFWEALGRRFTGLPYQEADKLSQINKEFIQNLFPEEDIYLTLLDSKARFVLGRVGEATMPAKHLLESMGFVYLNEVDPFDGGPHYGTKTAEIGIIEHGRKSTVSAKEPRAFDKLVLIGHQKDDAFRGVQSPCAILGEEIALPAMAMEKLNVEPGMQVFWSAVN